MDGVMSQEEINALLKRDLRTADEQKPQEEVLTRQKKIQSERLPISAWEQRQPHCFPW